MTVLPVVDYEPTELITGPASGGATPPADRRRLYAVPTPPPEPSVRLRAAATFADAALRGVLEVIDRRRLPAQLRPMLATELIDAVIAFARSMPGRRSGAVLRRVRLQAADADERAFEVSASYTRGTRMHAMACRVERTGTAHGDTWLVVALHVG